MPNNRRQEQDRRNPERIDHTQKTIAILKFGTKHYLVQQRADGAVVLNFIDPEKRRLDFIKATRKLKEKNFVTFENNSPAGIKVVNFALSTPKISWCARTQVTEEPTVILQTTNAIKNGESESINIYEEELLDLFLDEKPNKNKSASFFTIDSTENELIGIALNREYPVIVFIQPAKDGGKMVPQQGLISLIKGIYNEYRKKLSNLQKSVDDRLFDEFGPSGQLNIEVGSGSGATGIRHQELVKSIYLLKALLIAGEANKKSTGVSDPDLMAHMPFVKNDTNEPEEEESFLKKLFGDKKPDTIAKMYNIGFEQWNKIVTTKTETLFTKTASHSNYRPWQDTQQSARPARVQEPVVKPPIEPTRPVVINTVRPTSTSTSTRPHRPPVARPTTRPVRRPTNPTSPDHRQQNRQNTPSRPKVSEAEKREKIATMLAKRVSRELENMTTMFEQIDLLSLNEANIDELNVKIKSTLKKLDSYFKQNPQPIEESQLETIVSVKDSNIKLANLDSKALFAFLTGYKALDYKEKINLALSMLNKYVGTASSTAPDKYSRTFRGLQRKQSSITSQHPEIAQKLIVSSKRTSREFMTTAKNSDILSLAQIALALQITNSLVAQYKKISSGNQPGKEMIYWLKYCRDTLNKVNNLSIPNSLSTNREESINTPVILRKGEQLKLVGKKSVKRASFICEWPTPDHSLETGPMNIDVSLISRDAKGNTLDICYFGKQQLGNWAKHSGDNYTDTSSGAKIDINLKNIPANVASIDIVMNVWNAQDSGYSFNRISSANLYLDNSDTNARIAQINLENMHEQRNKTGILVARMDLTRAPKLQNVSDFDRKYATLQNTYKLVLPTA